MVHTRNWRLWTLFVIAFVLVAVIGEALAQDTSYVSYRSVSGAFKLTAAGKSVPLCVSSADYPGVARVAKQLQADIGRVTGAALLIAEDSIPATREILLVGTLGKSPLIDRLVLEKKFDVSGVAGKWEVFVTQVIENPFPNVSRALVIAGSDKRGTIYGMYDLSAKIGVSPWYWWADVPVQKQSQLYVLPGRHSLGEPAVKYRGIFVNDEAPALSGWANEKFGGFNHTFYEKVFELILRLKGNYLWPAMWGRAFYVDDPINPKLADEYGVVIGTSHHEPMVRAHAEWAQFGKGPWNYEKNDSVLKAFWHEGIRRMGSNETVVTLGMRGDGDEPMTENANIALLERIVRDQRKIIGDVTGKDVSSIPQVWALYKEVQEYYDKGMRVPDDVTLLLCDDNWGNIRKLPKLTDRPRSGGYGIYYHYDYVGGPRNYKWLNTNQISRVWEQMNLAYRYGANRIWIVNVGDIKPMEFPTEFFLDYAWNPDKWPAESLPACTRQWAERQFGRKFAAPIAEILTSYTKFNSRRKPELLSPDTYSLTNYREAERVVEEFKALKEKASHIAAALPAEYRDAFYQLVLHPVKACSNLNDLYVTVGKNRLYATQGRYAATGLGQRAKTLYFEDSLITDFYNHKLVNGKWNHMMDQTHIGYTYWQQPDRNSMPDVKMPKVPHAAEMGIAIEGSERWWPQEKSEAVLPAFDRYVRQRSYIEIFNGGASPFNYSIITGEPWILVSKKQGQVLLQERIWVTIDWSKAPSGKHQVPIVITAPNGNKVAVLAIVSNPLAPDPNEIHGFVESNGCVSMEAEHFSRAVSASEVSWQKIPDLGRTLSAMTPMPVTAASKLPAGDGPRLEYRMYLFSKGEVRLKAYLSPTLNFHNTDGLRYAVSFDNEQPQIINMHTGKTFQDWEESVRNNISIEVSKHKLAEPGDHVLRFWMVDPGVVLQKLVVETGDVGSTYLGPPESSQSSLKK